MKRFKTMAIVTLIAAFALVIAMPGMVFAAERTVTILHTNDTHGRFVSGGNIMGIDLIAAIKADTPNSILVDAGDTFHGLPFATLNRGADAVALMNMAGYAVMTPGNHDFNYGFDRLLELRDLAEFEIISSNIFHRIHGNHLLEAGTIIEVDGVKIGFFGLTTPETYFKTNPSNIVGIEFRDPVAVATLAVEALKELGADVIVAITHLGIDETTEVTSIVVAENVPGIDIIIDGHSHSRLDEGLIVGDTLIASMRQYLENMGVVTITVDEDNNILSIEASLISAAEAAEMYEPHPYVAALISEIREEQNVVLNEVVTEIGYHLDSARSVVRAMEAPLGNLVTDAMVHGTGADIAVTNGGGLRADLEGVITRGDVVATLPFGNFAVTKSITPADLKEILENGVKGSPAEVGEFPQVSGFAFTYNSNNEPGSRVVSVMINGEELDLTDTTTRFILATNDFMANGGDGYTVLRGISVENEFSSLEEMLYVFLRDYKEREYADVEGRIVDAAAGAAVPEAAAPAAPATPAATGAAATGKGVVYNTSAVNVRTGAFPTFDIITAITRGTEFEILGWKDRWYNVRLADGREGWIFENYVQVQ